MKNIKSKIAALALALVMAFGFAGCSMGEVLNTDGMWEFIKNGWDGIYEITARAEYVAPNPQVRTNAIRENHKVTSVKNQIRENHKVNGVRHEVGQTSADNEVAQTDYVD